MMRGTVIVLGLSTLAAVLAGCTQQCFVTEADLNEYTHLMPANLEHKADAGATPLTPPQMKPVTVDNPGEREQRYLSLQEAIAIALEHGTTGIQSVRLPGTLQDDLLTPNQTQQLQFSSDSNRVLSLNPAIAGANIEAALARFDVLSVTNMSWTATDEPPNGFSQFSNGESAHAEQTFVKPLPTGGVAGITFSTDYTLLSQPPTNFPITNPAYTPRLRFSFDHPLLQNYGTEINELLPQGNTVSPDTKLSPFGAQYLGAHNGQILNNVAGQQPSGILIARLRFDQSRAQFETAVNFKLLNVEVAYWNLYAAYVSLYASESGLRQAHRAWLETKLRFVAGKASEAEVAAAQGQYESFRGDRINALNVVLEDERVLRGLLGLPGDDGKQLVPADAPTVAPYVPDWDTAVHEALTNRPELIAARQELKVRQYNVILARNFLKPDLRFSSKYEPVGLGTNLDGPLLGPINPTTGQPELHNALHSLTSDNFNDWSIGLTLQVPLGHRFEHAQVRQAELALAQAHISLQNEERKAVSFLTKAYRDIFNYYAQIQARRSERIAYAKQVEADIQLVKLGSKTIEFLLQAEQQFATALSQEYQAIANYNSALAIFEFAKGTIQQHDNVTISEGPLPQCAQVRAVEHERERTHALVLRERAQPVRQEPLSVEHGTAGLPDLPAYQAPSVPALMAGEMPVNSKAAAPQTAAAQGADAPRSEAAPSPPSQTVPAGPTLAPQSAAPAPDQKVQQTSFTGPAPEPLVPTTPQAGSPPELDLGHLPPGFRWQNE
jgi:outer membrane protein TolC